jgi:peptide/nickel transport system permease protein
MNSLIKLAGTRLLYGFATLFVVSIVIFFAVELLPGDVAQQILGRDATPETLAALRERLGLNEPAIMRYFAWLGGILQGNLGESLVTGQPIGGMVFGRLGNTLFLALFAAVVAIRPSTATPGSTAPSIPSRSRRFPFPNSSSPTFSCCSSPSGSAFRCPAHSL